MVIAELLGEIKKLLRENKEFEARQIVMSVMDIDLNQFIFCKNNEVLQPQYDNAMSIVKRRLNGEPLQYILGSCEFMSLPFKLNKDTLIPRSDTETLVEFLIEHIADKCLKILDIGTGSGCIGISLAKYTKADVTLLDVSKNALDMARYNGKINNVSVKTIEMDILKNIPQGKYDVIVSNPPYIQSENINVLQTEVKDYEPYRALDGGKDGLDFYRRITKIAPQILNTNGVLAYEIGYDQANDVKVLMETGFDDIKILKDLCNNDRVVFGKIKV